MRSVTFLDADPLIRSPNAGRSLTPTAALRHSPTPEHAAHDAPLPSPTLLAQPAPSSQYTRVQTDDRAEARPVDEGQAATQNSEDEPGLDYALPYVTPSHVLSRHMVTRVLLLVFAVATLICSAVGIALPLCELNSAVAVCPCTVRDTTSSWLLTVNASFWRVGHEDAMLAGSQDTSGVRLTLLLLQVGTIGSVACAAVALMLSALFLLYRWRMESARKSDNRDANRRVHRLSEIYFTRREEARVGLDRAIGWSLAIIAGVMLVLSVVALAGLARLSGTSSELRDVLGRDVSLSVAPASATVVLAVILSLALLACLLVPWLSDFHPCHAYVQPVRFLEVVSLDTEETAQSRALREEVRQQREQARQQREEAARRANTMRGLTLEQSMPPSPWELSLYSYLHRSHGPTGGEAAAESSVFWRRNSVSTHLTSVQFRPPLPAITAGQELSFTMPTAKLDLAPRGSGDTQSSSDGLDATATGPTPRGSKSPHETWLIAADGMEVTQTDAKNNNNNNNNNNYDDADDDNTASDKAAVALAWTDVQSPYLSPALRTYMCETATDAMQAQGARPTTAGPPPPRRQEQRRNTGGGGAARRRGLSTEDLSTSPSQAPTLSSSSGVMALTSFSVGWRNAATAAATAGTGTTEISPHRSAWGRAAHDGRETDSTVADPTFTELLCVTVAPTETRVPANGARRRAPRLVAAQRTDDAVSVGASNGSNLELASPVAAESDLALRAGVQTPRAAWHLPTPAATNNTTTAQTEADDTPTSSTNPLAM